MTDEEREAAIEAVLAYLKSSPIFPECFTHRGGQRLAIEAGEEWAKNLVNPGAALQLDGPSLEDMIHYARKDHAPAHAALRAAAKLYAGLKKPPPPELVSYLSEDHSPKFPSKALQGQKALLLRAIAWVCWQFVLPATRSQPIGDDEVGGRECGCSIVQKALEREGITRIRESGLAKLWTRSRHLVPDHLVKPLTGSPTPR